MQIARTGRARIAIGANDATTTVLHARAPLLIELCRDHWNPELQLQLSAIPRRRRRARFPVAPRVRGPGPADAGVRNYFCSAASSISTLYA